MAKRTERVEVTIYKGDGATCGGHQFLVELFDENGQKIKRPDGCNLFANLSISDLKQAVEWHKAMVRDKFEEMGQEVPEEYRDLEAEADYLHRLPAALANVEAENRELKSQLLAHHLIAKDAN
jgi:hypothetical protein